LSEGVAARLEIWPRMIHVFQAYTYYFPDAQRAIDEIGMFVRKHIQ
jgi:acetyl esterase/lipase